MTNKIGHVHNHAPQETPALRTLFAGSPQFAADILATISDTPWLEIVAVITQPDKPKGRGRKLERSHVKVLAEELELPVLQPTRLKPPAFLAQLTQLRPDVMVVVAYGKILPVSILTLPPLGCLNVHASLLPRWRGAAPIERAVMAGDKQTGVGIMQMEAGLDTGPVFTQQAVPINLDLNIEKLESDLARLGGDLLLQVLHKARQDGSLPHPTDQPEVGITYADKLSAQDRDVDWDQPAESIHRQIWSLAGRMPTRVSLHTETTGQAMQLLGAETLTDTTDAFPGTLIAASKAGIDVACGTGVLRITRIKMEKGKGNVLDAAAALNGYRDLFVQGARFASI